MLKSNKYFLFLQVLLICLPSFAATEGMLFYCKNGAESDSKYAYELDNRILESKLKFSTMSRKQWTAFINILNAELDEQKDILFQAFKNITDNENDKSKLIDFESRRIIYESTLTISHTVVVENFKNDSLGKSRDFYNRIIYMRCTKN